MLLLAKQVVGSGFDALKTMNSTLSRQRKGRPKIFEDAELLTLLEEDPWRTQEELASKLVVTRQAISRRLKDLQTLKVIQSPSRAKPRK